MHAETRREQLLVASWLKAEGDLHLMYGFDQKVASPRAKFLEERKCLTAKVELLEKEPMLVKLAKCQG